MFKSAQNKKKNLTCFRNNAQEIFYPFKHSSSLCPTAYIGIILGVQK